jgi:uncharacterized membrane protein
MSTGRLEAFSDGVFAIIITIMVLEFKVPKGHEFASLRPLIPTFVSYLLSFVLVANYWNNHHHLLQLADRVNGKILWANAHLLFWLSLTPIATSWMGENDSYSIPVAFYGVLQLGCGMAFLILTRSLLSNHDSESLLATVVGAGNKEKLSVLIYFVSIPLAFLKPWLAFTCYFLVAAMWLIPDKRIDRVTKTNE